MAKKSAKFWGVILIVLGVLGVFWNPVFGIFQVDAIHNMIHILLGAVLLMFENKNAAKGMKIVSFITLLVAILGFVATNDMILGIIATNGASNWLHLIVAVLIFVGAKHKTKIQTQGTSSQM